MEKLCIATLLNSCLVATLLFSLVHLANASTEDISVPHFGDTQDIATFENEHVGLKLEYPSTWSAVGSSIDSKDCKPESIIICGGWLLVNASGGLGPEGVKLFFMKDVAGQHDCNCENLTDYLRYKHEALVENADESTTISDFHFVDDNQTTIGKDNHSAWQLQYSQKERDEDDFTSHNITSVYWMAKINSTFYQFKFETSVGENFTKYYPVAKSILDSVEFIPSLPERIPSFMQGVNNTQNLSFEGQSEGEMRIEGTNSFIQPNSFVGDIFTVVGEVYNDSPRTLTFVSPTITLYDRSGGVIGTDTTYTEPSSI
jgi:hypothetical protein